MQYFQEDEADSEGDEEEKYPGDLKGKRQVGSGSTQPQTVLGRKTHDSSSPLDRSAEDAKFRSSDSGGVYDGPKARDSSHVSIESGPTKKALVKEKEGLQVIRETVSDTEEESHGRLSLSRKTEMLNIRDAEQEFEIKS